MSPNRRGARRRQTAIRGNTSLWLILGLVLAAVGAIGQWWWLAFVGLFLVPPALVMLIILHRAQSTSSSTSQERS